MRWAQMIDKLKLLLEVVDPPTILILHCGGNDIMYKSPRAFREKIVNDIAVIVNLLPTTTIVWSQILPRYEWKLNKRLDVEKNRKRLNSYVAKQVLDVFHGAYFKYPEIVINQKKMFLDDNVHLSPLGTDIFLNVLSGGIEFLLHGAGSVFPDVSS